MPPVPHDPPPIAGESHLRRLAVKDAEALSRTSVDSDLAGRVEEPVGAPFAAELVGQPELWT